MKLSNPNMKLFVQADGDRYEVEAVCQTMSHANSLCAANSNLGVIAEDECENIYVANLHPRRSIRVTFANGDTMDTEINGTVKSINEYYVGKTFNVGLGPNDNMQKAVKVEFYS